MPLNQIPITAIATGVNAVEIPLTVGGSYLFSIQGNFDGNTAKLVMTQDTPANYADANFTQLTANGGFPILVPQNHVLALDLGGGGASPDLTYTLDPLKTFTRDIR